MFQFLTPDALEEVLTQAILPAPMFATRWRWTATRSLALLRHTGGRRVPPQILRMRSEDLLIAVFPHAAACPENLPGGDIEIPDHPLVSETVRDCLTEPLDLDGARALIARIESGGIALHARDVAEASPLSHAIINAFDYIRIGKADMFVCGGSEAVITATGIGGFNSMKALSERNDSPTTASRPYDNGRDGFVQGEGAAALILEEYEHAVRRGAKIYCEIVGTGMTADAHHITAPHPEGLGAANAMRLAINEAGLRPDEVDYLNTHGTSTPLGDVAELKAIQKVFGEAAYQLNISSTKSMTGHLLGAAGSVEAVACILAMQEGFVPPTINHFEDDPEIDPKLNLTFNVPQKRDIKVALSNTFGFGGHNTSIVMKKHS